MHWFYVEQEHSPLAFLSGCFDETKLGWSVLEKEASVVLKTLERIHWIFASAYVLDLYKEYNNLIIIFDPLSVVPDLSATSMRKVQR